MLLLPPDDPHALPDYNFLSSANRALLTLFSSSASISRTSEVPTPKSFSLSPLFLHFFHSVP